MGQTSGKFYRGKTFATVVRTEASSEGGRVKKVKTEPPPKEPGRIDPDREILSTLEEFDVKSIPIPMPFQRHVNKSVRNKKTLHPKLEGDALCIAPPLPVAGT